jgi:hypothetical protein
MNKEQEVDHLSKSRLLKYAYSELNKVTPLMADCGELCKKACCKGDQNTGMYLFPGEALLHRGNPFLTIRATAFSTGSSSFPLAACKGSCVRSLRPLACRIFPVTPYITPNHRLAIIIDPRARFVCPIADNLRLSELNPRFMRAVQRVSKALVMDEETRQYLYDASRIIDEHTELRNMLLKPKEHSE